MRKRQAVAYAALAAAFTVLYLLYGVTLRQYLFNKFQDAVPARQASEKLLFINGDFSIRDYVRLFDRVKPLENSVVLLLPQVFNMKISDYIDDMDSAGFSSLQQDYREFTVKLAETANVIPVAFAYRDKPAEDGADPCGLSYFKAQDIREKPARAGYIRAKSRKMWLASSGTAFFTEFTAAPLNIPVLYNYNGCVLVSAPVEAIRRYYKMS
ncbi:MAG TPA: hypothetical protein P5511_08110, partial [Candidatus Goldiibacteriota bacterium]|nr:hypothetical protein [Candidatus Goldiibacteriota bacterium]